MSTDPLPLARRRVGLVIVWIFTTCLLGAVIDVGLVRPKLARSRTRAAEKAAREKSDPKFHRPATSVVRRSGLPHLTRKMRSGEAVTIAFLGGSITEHGDRGGFVSAVPAWIATQSPGTSVRCINAGKSATGSDLGARRIEHDVLVQRPDVVFVEFAVNDSGRKCAPDMERIVRKIRLADAQTDIVFLYCAMKRTLPGLEAGKFPSSVNRQEAVAEHYGIPTIALGYEAANRIRVGKWKWTDFSADACHPTPEGYATYTQDIDAALRLLLPAVGPEMRPLPASLTPDLVLDPPTLATTASPAITAPPAR